MVSPGEPAYQEFVGRAARRLITSLGLIVLFRLVCELVG